MKVKLLFILILLFFVSSCHVDENKENEATNNPSTEEEIEIEFYLCVYANETLKLNDHTVSLDSLGALIEKQKEIAGLEDLPKIVLVIDKSVKMKLVSNVEDELRKINALRIKYSSLSPEEFDEYVQQNIKK
jgi:biopolymer transport protein ExbD